MAAAKTQTATASDSNLMGAVAYIFGWLSGLIVYLIKPEDKFARFHALQSIFLSVAAFVVMIVVGVVLGVILAVITIVTAGIGGLLSILLIPVMLLFWLVIILVHLFCAWKAYSGEKFMLPVLGGFAEKYA